MVLPDAPIEPIVPVDFFLIGAGKCGSTWLAQCLDEHPEIAIAEGKEPEFFVDQISAFDEDRNPHFMRNWNFYNRVFRHATPQQLRGDCSINLMHNVETAPALISRYYPNARLLVILRNPVDRTYSHYWHERLTERRKGVPSSFEDALANKDLIFRSSYFEQLNSWLQYFDLSDIHVTLDLDMKNNVGMAISSIFRFLEVDEDFMPISSTQRVNDAVTCSRALTKLHRIVRNVRRGPLAPLPQMIDTLGVSQFVWKLGTRPNRYPPMNVDTRKRLRDMLRSDIERLEDLIGRDLSEWMM